MPGLVPAVTTVRMDHSNLIAAQSGGTHTSLSSQKQPAQGCTGGPMSDSPIAPAMLRFGSPAALLALALACSVGTASAETADTVLFNGKIVIVDKDFSIREALAIANGRVLASGTTAAIKKLAGDKAKMIDLGGRTVIPGLTDGHIHGIRAALTFGTEVNWIGVPTLKEALERMSQAAKAQ